MPSKIGTEKTEPLTLKHAGGRRRVSTVIACLAVSGSVVALSGSTLAVAAAPPGAVAAAAPGAASPDGHGWVRSARSVPALPPGSRVLHAVALDTEVHADVVLKPRDPAALEAFDTAVSTPGSPSFRHYLPVGAFAGEFGPTAATISSVRSWLEGRGLVVGPTAGDGLVIPVSGSVAQIDHAFALGLEQYRLPSGRVVQAPDAEPLVPDAVAGDLYGVTGLDNLDRPAPELVRPSAPAASASGVAPAPALVSDPRANGPAPTAGCSATIEGNPGSAGALTVDQLASAYSFSNLYPGNEGSGVSIGIYELEPFLTADINRFKACYSPAITASVSGISVDGANPNAGAGQGEAALDIEMVIGMAPNVTAKVYVGPNNGSGPLDTYVDMVNRYQGNNPPPVITTSWGECEAQLSSAYIQGEATLFEQAVAQGQTVVAAGGDEGSEDCYIFPSSNDTRLEVDDPGSQPWVTSVGGTTIDALGPPPTESVWNTGLFAGTAGGGISTRWTMPAWQLGAGVQKPYTKSADTFTGAQPCPLSAGRGHDLVSRGARRGIRRRSPHRARRGVHVRVRGLGQDRWDEHGCAAVGRTGRARRPGPVVLGRFC